MRDVKGWFRFEELRIPTGPDTEAVIPASDLKEIVLRILEDRPLAERILGFHAWQEWQDVEGRYDLVIQGSAFGPEVSGYIRRFSDALEPDLLSGWVSTVVWRAAIGWRLEVES